VKLLRTFAAQTEALQRYRGKGQQKVTVSTPAGRQSLGSVSQSDGVFDSFGFEELADIWIAKPASARK